MELKMSPAKQQNLQTEETKLPAFGLFTGNVRKLLGKGIAFLRGIWNEQSDSGQNTSITGNVTEAVNRRNGRTEQTGVISAMAAETLADIRPPKQTAVVQETESGRLAGVIPALKVKTGQARERFEAKKEAFLKRMKETAKKRKGFLKDSREERPGQQEKQMEWYEMENIHLLDSYNKNGEYTNLGNQENRQGYSGNPMKDNYSTRV